MTKLSELKAGDVLIADVGFPCLEAGKHTVQEDGDGLFLPCAKGKHYLEGQVSISDEDTLIGLTKAPHENVI